MSEEICNKPQTHEIMRALFHGSKEYTIPILRRLIEHDGYEIPLNNNDLLNMSIDLMGGRSIPRRTGGFTLKERQEGYHYNRCEQCRKLLRKPF